MSNRVNFSLIPFPPIQWSGDIFQLAQLLVDHLQGNVDQSVFSGQLDGTEPTTDIGLWLDDDVWKRWDAEWAKYVPLGLVAGLVDNGTVRTARLNATNTSADIELDLPEEGGTLARIEDVNSPVETITHAGNTITIDWTKPNKYAVISGNVTIVDGGSGDDGATAKLWIETPPGHATALTITFPAIWRKDNIALSTTDATHRSVDKFLIERVGADTFVTRVGTYSIDQSGGGDPTHGGGDTTPPVFVSAEIRANHNLIKVKFNELIQGTSPASAWTVTKNGNAQNISTVEVGAGSGAKVFLTLANPIGANSEVTVRYTSDGSVKDIAGNAAISFGPETVDVVT